MIIKKEYWPQPHLTLLQAKHRTKKYPHDNFVQLYDDYIHEDDSEKIESYIRMLAKNFYRKGYQDGYVKAKHEQDNSAL